MTSQNIVRRAAASSRPVVPDRSPASPRLEMEAAHDGLCPVCMGYIRAGRSTIAALDIPLPPDPSALYHRHGEFVDAGNRPVSTNGRRWVHARCARHVPEDAEELAMLADERRHELRTMRRSDDEPPKRRGGQA